MLRNLAIILVCSWGASLSAIESKIVSTGGVNLESFKFKDDCDKLAKTTYDRDLRSLDVYCETEGEVHEALLDPKADRDSTVIEKQAFTEKFGYLFSNIYGVRELVSNKDKEVEEYREYRVGRKVIGYRGKLTVSNPTGVKVVLGAYYSPTKQKDKLELAKIFVLDRSKIKPRDIPEDFVGPLSVFEARVRAEQDLWLLTAEIVSLPGKDLYYSSSAILLDLAEKLGDIFLYGVEFKQVKKVTNPAKFLHSENGAYCENFIGIDTEAKDADKQCEKATNDLVKGMTSAPKSDAYLLYAGMDEEEKGYILMPSKQEDSRDLYLKVFFDIGHNE